jgi:acyl-coenzyme A thioesterase PaaI-like protein
MPESWKTKLMRWRFNWYPAYRRTGAQVVYISEDLLELRVRLPLTRATRNLHGSIYGGSMYAAVDPLHAVMLARHLGPDFHVWMKAARIEFRRPGRSDLYATARLDPAELATIRTALGRTPKLDRDFTVTLTDLAGTLVAAEVTTTIHIRRRAAHEPPMETLVYQP